MDDWSDVLATDTTGRLEPGEGRVQTLAPPPRTRQAHGAVVYTARDVLTGLSLLGEGYLDFRGEQRLWSMASWSPGGLV